jgi:hypothetical protein
MGPSEDKIYWEIIASIAASVDKIYWETEPEIVALWTFFIRS